MTHAIQHLAPIIINEHCRLNSWCESLNRHAHSLIHLLNVLSGAFSSTQDVLTLPGPLLWGCERTWAAAPKGSLLSQWTSEEGPMGLHKETKASIWIWCTRGTMQKSESIQISPCSWMLSFQEGSNTFGYYLSCPWVKIITILSTLHSIMKYFMTLISLIVLGCNSLPWNLIAGLRRLLLFEEDTLWCLWVTAFSCCFPPLTHGFLQLFCQTVTSSHKEQVLFLDVTNSSAPVAPLQEIESSPLLQLAEVGCA